MLILTRKLDEEIIIGDNIKICVLGIQGNQVKLGIDAPRETAVNRKEIYDLIQSAKKSHSGEWKIV
jgi:carbon storage regulator